jgi:hypothetical protein
MKFHTSVVLENLLSHVKFCYNLTIITGNLHEYIFTFMKISRLILLRMGNVTEDSSTETQNTLFKLSNFSFFENRAAYDIMWKNIVQPDRSQMTI